MALRRAEQDGKAFADIDLGHPEIVGMADDLVLMQRNFEDLKRVGRGTTAAAIRAGGYDDFLQWHEGFGRQFVDDGARRRHEAQASGYILSGTGGRAPLPRPAPAPVAPLEPPAPDETGAEGGGAGGGFNPLALLGGPIKWLLAMAGVGAIAKMAGQAVHQAEAESTATDTLLRHIRDSSTDFDGLRQSVRSAAEGLQLTYQQANQLTLAWTGLTNASTAAGALAGMRGATGFARGYGLDPMATVQTLGKADFLGVDPGRFATLIAEAVSGGGMSGQVTDVMHALLHWTETASHFTLHHNDLGAFTSLYTDMNASRIPGLRGANGVGVIDQMNSSIMHGGGAGTASMFAIYNALAGHGVTDPFDIQKLLSHGMFATPHGVLGHGDTATVFSDIWNWGKAQYAGLPQSMWEASMSGLLGVSIPTVQMLEQMPSVKRGALASWIGANHVQMNAVSMSALGDLADELSPSANLGEWRKRLLERTGPSALTPDERAHLRAATPGHLRDMMAHLLVEHGTDKTPGMQLAQSMASMSNALTKAGTGLVPIIMDFRTVSAKLVGEIGDLSTVLAKYLDKTNDHPTLPGKTTAEVNSRYVDPMTGGYYGPGSYRGSDAAPPPPPTAAARHRVMEEARHYFTGHGWTPAQTAGILANINAESGFDPHPGGDRTGSFGLFQFHGTRVALFSQWLRQTTGGRVTNPRDATPEQQFAFAQWELTKGDQQSAGRALHREKSAYNSTYVFSSDFERPFGGAQTAAMRAGTAGRFMPPAQPVHHSFSPLEVRIPHLDGSTTRHQIPLVPVGGAEPVAWGAGGGGAS